MLVCDCTNNFSGRLLVRCDSETSTYNFGVVAVVVTFRFALFEVVASKIELTDVTSTTSLKYKATARMMVAVLGNIEDHLIQDDQETASFDFSLQVSFRVDLRSSFNSKLEVFLQEHLVLYF